MSEVELQFDNIAVAAEDGIGTITLNRPDKRNPLSFKTVREMIGALEQFARDESVRVVIITATGRAFSAGGDFSETLPLLQASTVEVRDALAATGRLLEAIRGMEKPVIAAVNGTTTGGGCALAAVCDITLASDQARFATPEIKSGLFPMVTMPALLGSIGRKKAMELALSGDFVDAHEAKRIGLANEVVPHDSLMDHAFQWANKIKERSAVPVKLGKSAVNQMEGMDFGQALQYARHVQAVAFGAEDAREGIQAFLEKREPVWQDR